MDGPERWGSAHYTPSLGEARDRAREARRLLLDGNDPIEARRELRDQRRAQSNEKMLFRDAAQRFIETHRGDWKNPKHVSQWENTLRDYAYKAIGDRPVSAIDGALITDTLAPIWTKKSETARRVKQRIERVVQWVKDGMPLPTPRKSKTVRHHPALPVSSLPAFLTDLRSRESISARALEFTILTAARTAEVTGARWSEIEGSVWTVPAERAKTSKPHRVPLSPRAIEILSELPDDGSGFVFPGAVHGKPISNWAMLELLKGMQPGLTTHGFRSTFSDWARDSGYERDVVELALAHTIKDKTEAAYRRGDALLLRTRLMNDWAQFCSAPTASGKVVALHA